MSITKIREGLKIPKQSKYVVELYAKDKDLVITLAILDKDKSERIKYGKVIDKYKHLDVQSIIVECNSFMQHTIKLEGM